MLLYLLQHGESEEKEKDPNRPLTQKGRNDIQSLKKYLGSWEMPIIYHSGKLRAEQTAQIIAGSDSILAKENLAPNDSINAIFKEIEYFKKDLMIVGHLPFLSRLVSFLLIKDESHEIVKFTPGTLACLKKQSKNWVILLVKSPL